MVKKNKFVDWGGSSEIEQLLTSPPHTGLEEEFRRGGGTFKVFEWNKSNILKRNWLRLPKFASVGMVLNLPDLRYILLTLFDYNSLCCRSLSKTIFMYLNTLRVPLACHEAIMSHRDLHSSKITTIHQHLGPKRQNFKIQNPGPESQNHPKSKPPAHIQSVKSCKIQHKNEKPANEGFRMKHIKSFKRK